MKSHCLSVCIVAAVAFLWMAESKSDEPAKAATPAADPMRGKAPGDVRDDNSLKMKFVWCPPGVLVMEQVERITATAAKKDDQANDDHGDPKDKPALKPRKVITPVKVFLTQGYWLGRYEVTQSQWKQMVTTEPWKGQEFTKEGADIPATVVSWTDATEFCGKLTEQERLAGRLPNDWEYTLPTEAQWERACRARTETKFSFGDDESKLGDYAWFRDNTWDAGERYPHQVGQKKANPWGLFDMHGNAPEWCRDIYAEKLPGGRDPEVRPGVTTVRSRVIRGGSWAHNASFCSSAIRNRDSPSFRDSMLGFRVALSPVR